MCIRDRDNVVVRIFDRSELVDGDIGADFFRNLLGKDVNDYEPVIDQTESLSLESQLFLMKLNEHLPRRDAKGLSRSRANIGQLLTRIGEGKGLRPTEAQAREFYSLFDESNEAVRATWFPDRSELFSPDFSKYPAVASTRELSQDDSFRLFSELWSAKQDEVKKLRAEVQRLKSQS